MKFYPINLNIKGKMCIVIGGGGVAERKVKNILLCQGKVRLISPKLTSKLAELSRRKKIDYVKRKYSKSLLKGAYLVYAATSDKKANSRIAKNAGKSGILVNICDSIRESTFILPAVLRRKGVTIAVSTDGASPKKAVKIRDRLKETI